MGVKDDTEAVGGMPTFVPSVPLSYQLICRNKKAILSCVGDEKVNLIHGVSLQVEAVATTEMNYFTRFNKVQIGEVDYKKNGILEEFIIIDNNLMGCRLWWWFWSWGWYWLWRWPSKLRSSLSGMSLVMLSFRQHLFLDQS